MYYLGYQNDVGLYACWSEESEDIEYVSNLDTLDLNLCERDKVDSTKASMLCGTSVEVHDRLLYRVLSEDSCIVDTKYFRGIAKGFHCNNEHLVLVIRDSIEMDLNSYIELKESLDKSYSIDVSLLTREDMYEYWCRVSITEEIDDIHLRILDSDFDRFEYYMLIAYTEMGYFGSLTTVADSYLSLYLNRYKIYVDEFISRKLPEQVKEDCVKFLEDANLLIKGVNIIYVFERLYNFNLGTGCNILYSYLHAGGKDIRVLERLKEYIFDNLGINGVIINETLLFGV